MSDERLRCEPVHHTLNVWPKYFDALADGRKRFELRRDDRNFSAGDTVTLREFVPENETFTGRTLDFIITYVLRNDPWNAVKYGWCVFGIAEFDK